MKTIKSTAAVLLVQICVSCFGLTSLKERPNILFIHIDQMHWEAMSAYGNQYVKTPALDRLAEDGFSFRASYASMPQCCPARACWYTGLTSCETGMPTNRNKLRHDLPDLGQWLTKHGNYKSAYAGKWHVNGRDVTKSFDLLYGMPIGKGEYIDGSVARACMGFLENYTGEEPFFLNAGFLNPHDCCYSCGAEGGQGKLGFAGEIEDRLPPLPGNWVKSERPWGFTGDWTELDWRYYIYTYYRWVEMVDAEIASLYDALRNSRFADNTVVIFTADHGDGLGFHGNVSKGYMEEEAWRVPTIIIDPGKVLKGVQDEEHLSIGVDLAATICDYAQVPVLPNMTVGKSLRRIVEGKKVDDWREYIVGESFLGGGQVAVRDKQHKTILYCDGKPTKVYNLKNDPLEMNDLSPGPEGKAVMARHEEFLFEYLDKIEVYEPESKDREHEVYLKYYADFKKAMESRKTTETPVPKTVVQNAQGKTRKVIDRSVVNSYVQPCAIEPVTGYLSSFSPLAGPGMHGDFTAHYVLVAWMGAEEKSKNTPLGSLDITFENGQCRTIEKRNGTGTIAAPGSMVRTTMQLTGKNNTTTHWTLESQVEDRDHVKFVEEGLWDGTAMHLKARSWSRQMTTSHPLIHRWALLPLLASGSIKEAPLVFDMLDDAALRPKQILRYEGKIDVPVKGGEVGMDSYVQTGEGIVPIHYLVDDQGQVQLITMGTVNWALCAEPETSALLPYPKSTVITGFSMDTARLSIGHGDNWPITWADDDKQYSFFCDGKGFGAHKEDVSIAPVVIAGSPPNLKGKDILSESGILTFDEGGENSAKVGGLVMIRGTLFAWVRNINLPGTPKGTGSRLMYSKDHGKTWEWVDWNWPSIGYPVWLNAGKNYADARDGFAYFISPDGPSAYFDYDSMLMARVPVQDILLKEKYTFFGGIKENGESSWGVYEDRKAFFRHDGGCFRPDIVYNPGLKRYLLSIATPAKDWWWWSADHQDRKVHLGIFEAPDPWGPWKTVFFEEGWGAPENRFSPHIPPKWISEDGQTFYILYSCIPVGPYRFNIQKCTVTVKYSNE